MNTHTHPYIHTHRQRPSTKEKSGRRRRKSVLALIKTLMIWRKIKNVSIFCLVCAHPNVTRAISYAHNSSDCPSVYEIVSFFVCFCFIAIRVFHVSIESWYFRNTKHMYVLCILKTGLQYLLHTRWPRTGVPFLSLSLKRTLKCVFVFRSKNNVRKILLFFK